MINFENRPRFVVLKMMKKLTQRKLRNSTRIERGSFFQPSRQSSFWSSEISASEGVVQAFFPPNHFPQKTAPKKPKTHIPKKPLHKFSSPNQLFLSGDTATEKAVEAALRQSRTISPHIQDKLRRGTKIAGTVTYHYDRKSFEQACAGAGNTSQKCQSAGGFYRRRNDEIHLPKPPRIEALVHESVHKFSNDFRGAGRVVNEGLTQLFTNIVLAENRIPKGNAYPRELKVGEAIRDKIQDINKLASIFFTKGLRQLIQAIFRNHQRDYGGFFQLGRHEKIQEMIQYLRNHP